jgi:hypothetical protein
MTSRGPTLDNKRRRGAERTPARAGDAKSASAISKGYEPITPFRSIVTQLAEKLGRTLIDHEWSGFEMHRPHSLGVQEVQSENGTETVTAPVARSELYAEERTKFVGLTTSRDAIHFDFDYSAAGSGGGNRSR